MKPYLPLLAALLGLSQCKKDDPEASLPPATQTGANTFGCLVNGKAWTPRGNDGFSNFNINYDWSFHGGNLDVNMCRIDGPSRQYILFGGDSLSRTGTYHLPYQTLGASFTDTQRPVPCQEFRTGKGQLRRGTLTLTRLDLRAGIVSGTFAFTFYQPGCDSVRITQGRFDAKL